MVALLVHFCLLHNHQSLPAAKLRSPVDDGAKRYQVTIGPSLPPSPPLFSLSPSSVAVAVAALPCHLERAIHQIWKGMGPPPTNLPSFSLARVLSLSLGLQ